MNKAIAIIVAAGGGSRAGGGIPKQFRTLLGQSVLNWSARAFRHHPDIEQTVIVGPSDMNEERIADLREMCDLVVKGGASRAQSVQNGLYALSCTDETPILIHDAARPGLSQVMITNLLLALQTTDAVAPALPISDALKDTSLAQLQMATSILIKLPMKRILRLWNACFQRLK